MRRSRSRVAGVATLVTLAACGSGRDALPDVIVRDSAGIRIVEYQRFDPSEMRVLGFDTVPTRRLGGSGAASGPVLTYVIGRAGVSHERVIIADLMSQTLRLVDLNGGADAETGGRGEGPADYLYPAVVGSINDSIVVYDARLRRLSFLTSSGQLGRTVVVPGGIGPFFSAVGITSAGATVFMGGQGLALTGRQRVVQDTTSLVILDREGRMVAEFGRVPTAAYFEAEPSVRPRALEIPFVPGAQVAAGGDGIWVGDTERLELMRFDKEGVLRVIVRMPGQPEPVTTEDVDSALQNAIRSAHADSETGIRRLYAAMPIPDSKPPFEQLTVDDEGQVWVKMGGLPSDVGWVVLTAEGTLAFTAATPSGSALRLNENLAVMMTTDAFDAPVVSIYRSAVR